MPTKTTGTYRGVTITESGGAYTFWLGTDFIQAGSLATVKTMIDEYWKVRRN